MLDRQKRLNEVYDYLHNNLGVHTKGDFADNIKYARAYISSALNGNERYLTDSLFTNICEAYPDTFNLNYLLNGEGELLKSSKSEIDFGSSSTDMAADPTPAPFIPSWADSFFDIMTQQIKQNEALNRELHQSITAVNAMVEQLSKLITKFHNK